MELPLRLPLLVWWTRTHTYEASMTVETSTSIPTAMAIPYPSPTLLKLTCIVVVLLEFIFLFHHKPLDDSSTVAYNSLCSYKKVKNKSDSHVHARWPLSPDILSTIAATNQSTFRFQVVAVSLHSYVEWSPLR